MTALEADRMTALEREVRAERKVQGLPPKVRDASTIAQLAAMLRGTSKKKEVRRGTGKPRN